MSVNDVLEDLLLVSKNFGSLGTSWHGCKTGLLQLRRLSVKSWKLRRVCRAF
jgi:hypothetical protein